MNTDDVPWVTIILSVSMAVLFLIDPKMDTGPKYFILSPWMHSDFNHFWNNLALFLPLGIFVERRVGSLAYLSFAVLTPYLALHLPVIWNVGELSQGGSGLTKALTGYSIPVLLIMFSERLPPVSTSKLKGRDVGIALLMFLVIVFLTANSWVTIQRFVGFEAKPDGVSVASHFFGLVLGVLWFGWRSMRHDELDEL